MIPGPFSIFISSSSEQQAFAIDIADALSKIGQYPIRWWTSFQPSTYTAEALEGTLRQADAGIFLCVGDDRGMVRTIEVQMPRDNVILELGLFLGVLGRRRCFIVADQNNRLRLPSDLAGISNMGAGQDADSIASAVVKGIAETIGSDSRDAQNGCLHIRADSEVAMKINGKQFPPEWHQRALYYGTEGAQAWLTYSDDEYTKVQTNTDRLADEEQTAAALEGQHFRTFISLGPGDARRDKDVYYQLQMSNGPVQYIPVDISEGLIHWAVSKLFSTGALVPFGMLTDFEDGQDFMFDNVKSLPRPCLFALLGNTLGNLDIGAERFLRQIAGRMRRGDQLLLDVTTTTQKWEFDPYKSYFDSPVRRRFVAQGIARQLGIDVHEILSQFEDRIAAQRSDNTPEHVQQHVIYDKKERKIGLTLRAYNFEKFRGWIRKWVALKEEYAHDYPLSGYTKDNPSKGLTFGAGLLRLSKE